LPYLVDQPLHLYDGRPARQPENGFGGSGAELSFSLSSRRCLEGFHHQIGHHPLPPRAQEGQGAIKVEDRKTQPARSGVRAEDFQHVTLIMLEQRRVGRWEPGHCLGLRPEAAADQTSPFHFHGHKTIVLTHQACLKPLPDGSSLKNLWCLFTFSNRQHMILSGFCLC